MVKRINLFMILFVFLFATASDVHALAIAESHVKLTFRWLASSTLEMYDNSHSNAQAIVANDNVDYVARTGDTTASATITGTSASTTRTLEQDIYDGEESSIITLESDASIETYEDPPLENWFYAEASNSFLIRFMPYHSHIYYNLTYEIDVQGSTSQHNNETYFAGGSTNVRVYAEDPDPDDRLLDQHYETTVMPPSQSSLLQNELDSRHLYLRPETYYWLEADVSSTVELFTHSVQVPEPSTLLLLGAGLLGIAGLSRKKFQGK